MRILVACEYSGRVRRAFAAKGHEVVSCDLLPCDDADDMDDKSVSGVHYQGDVFDLLSEKWDLMIAHPPCTYLTCAAEWAYSDVQTKRIKPGTLIGAARRAARDEALDFVTKLWNAPVQKVCIENPVGVINARLPFMPSPQWIQHYEYGEDASKKTGLWTRGLPHLVPTQFVEPRMVCGCGYTFSYELGKYGCPDCCGVFTAKPRWGNQTDSGQNREPPGEDRWKIRSYTPIGLANAMADQWG